MKDRIIVLDTETTGLDYLTKDRVIEVAAIEILNGEVTSGVFHTLVNPQRSIDPESTKIHGISDEEVRNKPTFAEIYPKLEDFIADSKIVAHNAEFDRRILNLEIGLIGGKTLDKSRFIDSLVLAKILYKGERVSLDHLCEKLNIDNSARKQHGALIDTQLLAKVYLAMLKIIQEEDHMKKCIDLYNEHLNGTKTFKEQNFKSRMIKPTEEELAEHKTFLSKHLTNHIFTD